MIISKIRKVMNATGLDALILRHDKNRKYVTGFESSAGAVVITKEQAYVFVDSRYIEAARRQIEGFTIRLIDYEYKEIDHLKDVLTEAEAKTVGFEDATMTCADHAQLEKELPVKLTAAENIILALREGKTREEADAIKAALRISERALEDVLGLIKPGISEREIAAELAYRQLKYGGEWLAFPPIVVAGANGSMPHGVPGDYCIQHGDFVTMDFGCTVDGYCSDITRTVAVGGVTEEMRRVYDTVLESQLAGIGAAKPGVKGKDIDAAGREVIAAAGYGEYFGHGFGHSIGLDVHEKPNATIPEERAMPEGAVISAEPGIYIPGRFGVRIEDLIYLTGDTAENLTAAPKNLIIL